MEVASELLETSCFGVFYGSIFVLLEIKIKTPPLPPTNGSNCLLAVKTLKRHTDTLFEFFVIIFLGIFVIIFLFFYWLSWFLLAPFYAEHNYIYWSKNQRVVFYVYNTRCCAFNISFAQNVHYTTLFLCFVPTTVAVSFYVRDIS